MSALLKINDLWGGYTEGVDILRGISMEVQQGEAVGIIGLNGSGKSTFGKAIMNMIPIRRGEILFDGEDITPLSTSQLAHRGISIMQQGGRVFPNLSVWDNLQLATQANNNCQLSIVNSQLAELVPLLQRPKHELQHLMADKLSGGQKHQLSLAMTLATNPRLVILDEPSAGLSPKAVEEMYQMLRDVRTKLNVTIILIEQNIAKAVEFCDRNRMLTQGTILKEFCKGSINEIGLLMFKEITI
jgi:ABC-type branched-subunit amino acid transport system ATPase component